MIQNIKGSGGIIVGIGLIYYPLGNNCYAYNLEGSKGVSKAEFKEEFDEQKKKVIKSWWQIKFGEEIFHFEDSPIKKAPYRLLIDSEDIEHWLNPERKPTEISELFLEIKKTLNSCYDFLDERDCNTAALFIIQSWFTELLNGVFYVDIRSRMGGGKTLLLEIFEVLCRFGILANDISFSAIPRLTDRYKCTLLFDEIDNISQNTKEEVFKMLRVGYKPGSKYIRLKPKTFEDESFEVYSAKAYNYRSDVPDDLKNRSIPISTNKSNDKRLSIISSNKDDFLIPLHKKLWTFFMDSSNQVNKVNKVYIVKVNNSMGIGDNRKEYLSYIATYLLTLFTSENFKTKITNSEEMGKYLMDQFKNINGRNIELYTNIIKSCALLDLDIWEDFRPVFEDKEEFESHDETDTKAILRDILIDIFQNRYYSIHKTSLAKFVPYRKLAMTFNKKVYEGYGYKPSQNEMKKQLRELGFVDKINRKLLKVDGTPMLCLIFDHIILKSLGVYRSWDGIERRKETREIAFPERRRTE